MLMVVILQTIRDTLREISLLGIWGFEKTHKYISIILIPTTHNTFCKLIDLIRKTDNKCSISSYCKICQFKIFHFKGTTQNVILKVVF